LDYEYVGFCYYTEEELLGSIGTEVQMLYSPTVEQRVVLVGAFLFEDVAAEVWLEITANDKRERS